MKQDDRSPFHQALHRARLSAYPPGEFVGQESFMRASEVRSLAVRARIGPGVSVLDLCCGVAGPGWLITRELRCDYVGVDSSPAAIDIARGRAGDVGCRFVVSEIPPVLEGPFDVVLLLETMLAFPDKRTLVREVASALKPGGRFAFTLEEGLPLTESERARMPDADTVWLTPLEDMICMLEEVGLQVRWQDECTQSQLAIVDALGDAYAADSSNIADHIGRDALDELVTAHRLWGDWFRQGRARKFEFIAQRPALSQGG